jgi:hypothetical protein
MAILINVFWILWGGLMRRGFALCRLVNNVWDMHDTEGEPEESQFCGEVQQAA